MAGDSKPLESRVPIHLKDSLEALQMSRRTLGATIWAVEIDRRWRIRATPRPLVPGVDPQPTGLGAAASRI
jgi:hypothetical protein